MNKRRPAEQWRQILSEQKTQGVKDLACALANGVSVTGLRYWRRRLKESGPAGPVALVELPTARVCGELQVILPNGIVVVASLGWPVDHLAQVAGRLSSL